MKKLHTRTIIVASTVAATTAVIGIPAAIVYATKDQVSSKQIAQNIENKLEDEMFGTLNLLPSNKSGSFDAKRLTKNQSELNNLNNMMTQAREVFTKVVKSRVPLYGIINDVLTVSNKFDKWEILFDRIKKSFVDLQKGDYSALKEDLFDTSNNGEQSLFSPSYGVKRSDLQNKIVNGVPQGGVSYKVQHDFISFEDTITNLEKTKDTSLKQIIVSALQVLLGKTVNMNSDLSKLSNSKIIGSIPLMVISLKEQAVLKGPGPEKNLLISWETGILPAWTKRYQAIDQFYDDAHEPISGMITKIDPANTSKIITDDATLDAFSHYDTEFHKAATAGKTLSKTIDAFMDGTDISGKNYSTQYLPNWDFLRIFFGKALSATFNDPKGKVKDTFPGSTLTNTSDVEKGWESIINGSTINIVNGTESISVNSFWSTAVGNLFKMTIPTKYQSGPTIKGPEDRSLIYKLSLTNELETAFVALENVTKAYKTKITDISSDSFSIGIDLDKFKDVMRRYAINDDWKIKISSLLNNYLGQEEIDEVEKDLVPNKTGGWEPTTLKYHIVGRYIYPTNPKWLLRSTDSLSLENISYNDDSKIKQFNNEKPTKTLFKPYIRINEDSDIAKIEILWDHISGEQGGSDD